VTHERRLGCLVGPIVIADGIGRFNLHDDVWDGPQGSEPVAVVEHQAKSVLLVEKLNIFMGLMEDQFHLKNACLLACGNGYPGRSFRRVLRQINDQLKVPFHVLADNDPAGYEIYFLVARGGAGRSKPNKSMAIRDASFIGLRAADILRLGIDESVQIKLNEFQVQHLYQLRKRPWLKSRPEWRREIDQSLERETKVEIEALITLGVSYLSGSYLPERLAAGEWLRM